MPTLSAVSKLAFELLFEAFGVPVMVGVEDSALVPAVTETLPPGWKKITTGSGVARVVLRHAPDDRYELFVDETISARAENAVQAIQLLDAKLRLTIAEHAPRFVFIHAGVVAWEERALVMPGRSFTGKTTLVEALLRAGATYYSDEYAVLGRDGMVHPYPKPLSRRPTGLPRHEALSKAEDVDPRWLGAEVGTSPIPIALIASATYRSGARWEPQSLGPGESALALLAHAVVARIHPERVLAHIRRAVDGCGALEGERGEADETAALLLEQMTAGPRR